MITGVDVAAAARGWIGTPFHHQGRLKGVGADCAGLVIGVAAELGLSTFAFSAYARRPPSGLVMEMCTRELRVARSPAVGDVLALSVDGQVQHLAILSAMANAEWGMVHAYAPLRRVVEHRLNDHWRDALAGAWRLPGVA